MSFSSKITSSDLSDVGVIGLPDAPGLSTSAMQEKFEETVRSVAIPKHNSLIDELENSSAASSIGATAPTGLSGNTVQALIDDLNSKKENNTSTLPSTSTAGATDTFNIRKTSATYKIAFPDLITSIKTAIGEATAAVAGLFSATDKAKLDGIESGAQVNTVSSVNGQTGAVSLGYSDVGAAASSHTHTSSDITGLPTNLSDLADDSSHRTVTDSQISGWNSKSTTSWLQGLTTGQKIATVTINGISTDVYAPTGGGGGGGGGAVDSVNGQTGAVLLDIGNINDVNIFSVSGDDALVYNSTSSKWENKSLSSVAFSGITITGKKVMI